MYQNVTIKIINQNIKIVINNLHGLTITHMSNEPWGSPSDGLTLVSKEIWQKYNHKEPVGSTYDCLTLVIKKICPILTQNIIASPFINTTHETDITQKYNSLKLKYIEIIKNIFESERNKKLS